jgi:DNA polymerase IV (archaeal DinB-like DNA polymerase)
MTSDEKSRIVLAVDLDYFYAQSEEIRNPELKGVPVVICVFSGRTKDSGAVSTCNYMARSLGVKSGIPIVLAKRILSKHQEAVFLPMDKDYYSAISERIMEILRSHSSKMEQVSIDEAYLDVTDSTERSYAAARRLGSDIKKEILEEEHLSCSIGIGPNKLVAKMAADSRKPDGLTVITSENVNSFLSPLQVGKLFGIGPKTEEKLIALGVRTIGDLANYDEEKLAAEFGKNLGPGLKRSAKGIDDDPIRERELEQFSRIITLKHNAVAFDFGNELEPLCHDLTERLKTHNMQCASVGIIVITSELKTKSRAKKTDATDSEEKIREIVHELFRSFFSENPELVVRRAGIKLAGLKRKEPGTNQTLTDFFGN